MCSRTRSTSNTVTTSKTTGTSSPICALPAECGNVLCRRPGRRRAATEFATADYRLGDLTTITVGTTFAFHILDSPSQWTLRAEYIRQAGDSSPPGVIGVQRGFDLAPPIDTISVVFGYSLPF